MPEPKFEIYKDAAGKYRWRLKAPNGQIITVSEPYEAKADCKNMVRAIKTNAPKARTIDLTKEIYKEVKDIRRAQTSQEKESLKSLYIGVLLGALISVIGNFFVSFYFQTSNTPNLIGLIVSGLLLLLTSIALFYEARKYAA